jgi:hypothetical protein
MLKILGHSAIVFFLTLLTQLGGIAWLVSLLFKRHLLVFFITYIALTSGAIFVAPVFGRTPLSCSNQGPLKVQSWFYCLANRNYVTPEMKAVLTEAAAEVDRVYPGTQTLVLDANFPFIVGFPLLPHLSHNDGEKADLAFYYKDKTGYLRGVTRSPIGYFAFEDGPSDCPDMWPTLRWDFNFLQPLWPDLDLEPDRTRLALTTLLDDDRVGKVFLEPHLQRRLGLANAKLRFQGCRAARHDDHIHVQL